MVEKKRKTSVWLGSLTQKRKMRYMVQRHRITLAKKASETQKIDKNTKNTEFKLK